MSHTPNPDDRGLPGPPDELRLPLIGLGSLLGGIALYATTPALWTLPAEAWGFFAVPVILTATIVILGEGRRRR